MKWFDCKNVMPSICEEVLVWVDGYRGPAWGNNHALVAYVGHDGKWYEERHREDGPLIGVIMWSPIITPNCS